MSQDHPRITCDGCGADLTYTSNCEDYRLVLASQSKPPWTEPGQEFAAVTAMHIPNPLPEPLHFCGLRCVTTWATAWAASKP